jgi:hypothetical protein
VIIEGVTRPKHLEFHSSYQSSVVHTVELYCGVGRVEAGLT